MSPKSVGTWYFRLSTCNLICEVSGMFFHICSSLVSLDQTAGIYYPFPKAPEAPKPVRYRQSHRAREIKFEEGV